jgi:hypothetical protein
MGEEAGVMRASSLAHFLNPGLLTPRTPVLKK